MNHSPSGITHNSSENECQLRRYRHSDSSPRGGSSGQSNSHASKASGATIAVSFARAASERKMTVATGLRSTYMARPHSVIAAAIRSRWAIELWAKNTGYRPVHNTVAAATRSLATSRDKRHTPNRAHADTSSIEVRVTAG